MLYNYNKRNSSIARTLRKQMTPEEKHLWYDFLKLLPVTVNRQKTIGPYIVDFFIAHKKIVIEVDGIQHECEQNKLADQRRDSDFRELGITVLRYSNKNIHDNFHTVCEDILEHLGLKAADLQSKNGAVF